MAQDPIDTLLDRHPPRRVTTEGGVVACREAGSGPALVLLHGIGNQSGSWVQQLEGLAPEFRVIAWDAPGYGGSEGLADPTPAAADYAAALAGLLDALRVRRAVVAGSSLGALIAAAFAARWPDRVAGLLLLNPAGGYGILDPQERAAKLTARLERLERLGPEGMARDVPRGMLSASAAPAARALVAWSARQIRPDGYRQAARMLAAGRLVDDAVRFAGRCAVVAASGDSITPPGDCRAIADAFPRARFRLLEGPGHLSYVEAPVTINALIAAFARDTAPREAA